VRRALPIAIWIAVLALCALQVARTRFVADLSSFLPAAPTPEQRLLVDQLEEGALSRVLLVAIGGTDARTRARVSNALAERLGHDARFAWVSNGASAGFEREKAFLFAHRYALSPAVTPRRFTAAGLRAAISDTLALLASPAGALVKPLVARDPTGDTIALLEGLRPAQGPRTAQGVWVAPDGGRALLLARTRASGSDIDAQADAVQALRSAFAAARASAGAAAADASLAMTGPGYFAVKSRALVKGDVERFSLLGLAIVATLLLAVYRSARALALGLVPVISGALVAIAAAAIDQGASTRTGTIDREIVHTVAQQLMLGDRSRDAGERGTGISTPGSGKR
jgi:predicted exporter